MAGQYLVTVIDSMGCMQSEYVTVDAVNAVSVMSNAGVRVFPNPLKHGEPLSVTSTEPIEQVVLLDARGKIVFQTNTSSTFVQPVIELLSSGIYTIRLKAGDRYSSIRVVVVD